MRAKSEKRRSYAGLWVKILLKLAGIALAAFLTVLLARNLTRGSLADSITHYIGSVLRLDDYGSMMAYQYLVRNNIETLFALAVLALFLAFFFVVMKSLTRYFDQIADAIDRLAVDSHAEPRLPPELEYVENRMLKLQQRLERKAGEEKQAERRKNDLLIYSAHDIKTPLTSVLGYLTLLDGNPELSAPEREKYTRIALAKTRELDGMINEMFEITRYNMREIELNKGWIDLYGMLQELREEHYPLLRQGEKQVLIEMDEDLRVWGDAEKLARVFNNLLKNALFYSEAGSAIRVSARTAGDTVELRFANTCKPIPQTRLDRLFEQFYRGEGAGAANEGGAGLGLAIAREIVLLHGGTIGAENTDSGICFLVSLPAGQP